MNIDHIGYAVKRLDRALAAFGSLGFAFGTPVDDPDRNVKLAFGEKDGYRVELVAPLQKGVPSPVDAYLSAVGPAPYHVCYRSGDLPADVAALEANGFRVVLPPRPAVAFGGKNVVFLMNLGLGLLEIVEA